MIGLVIAPILGSGHGNDTPKPGITEKCCSVDGKCSKDDHVRMRSLVLLKQKHVAKKKQKKNVVQVKKKNVLVRQNKCDMSKCSGMTKGRLCENV